MVIVKMLPLILVNCAALMLALAGQFILAKVTKIARSHFFLCGLMLPFQDCCPLEFKYRSC